MQAAFDKDVQVPYASQTPCGHNADASPGKEPKAEHAA